MLWLRLPPTKYRIRTRPTLSWVTLAICGVRIFTARSCTGSPDLYYAAGLLKLLLVLILFLILIQFLILIVILILILIHGTSSCMCEARQSVTGDPYLPFAGAGVGPWAACGRREPRKRDL